MSDCKLCQTCLKEKPTTMFYRDKSRKDGFYPECKECQNERHKRWYQKNISKERQRVRDYVDKNINKVKEYRNSKSYKTNQKNYMKYWRKENQDKLIEYKKNYHNQTEMKDPCFRILKSLRGRLLQALKNNVKKKHTIQFIGCSVKELKSYLESKFDSSMSWENYGRKGWHIDHIIPCAKFDLSKLEEQEKCFHYTNLQPLWWYDNCMKSDSVAYTIHRLPASNLQSPGNEASHPL